MSLPGVFHSRFMFIRHIFISGLELNFLQSFPMEARIAPEHKLFDNQKWDRNGATFPR
jgi:hypothetical protein